MEKSFSIGRNRAKTKHGLDLNKATYSDCGFRLDSLKHMCLDCPHDSISQIRESAFRDTPGATTRPYPSNLECSYSQEAVQQSLEHLYRKFFWTGAITEAQLENVFGAEYDCALNSRGLRNLEIVVVNLLQPLYAAAKQMIQDRSRRNKSCRTLPQGTSP